MWLCRNRFKIVLQPITSRHKFQLYTRFTPVRPATAVRSSNRPALLVDQHLTGWKGLAVPYDGLRLRYFLRAEGYSRGNVVNFSLLPRSGIRRGRPIGRPLRAEGFPKRRCQFESVAAQRHLSPRRSANCEIKSNLSGPSGHLPYKGRLIVNTLLCVSVRRRWCARLGRCRTRRSSCGRTRCPSGRVLRRLYRYGRWSATCR